MNGLMKIVIIFKGANKLLNINKNDSKEDKAKKTIT